MTTINKNSVSYKLSFDSAKRQVEALDVITENLPAVIKAAKAAKKYFWAQYGLMKPNNQLALYKEILFGGFKAHLGNVLQGALDGAGIQDIEEVKNDPSSPACHYCGAKVWDFNADRSTTCCNSN